jgi:hypothetical protein
MHDECLSSDLEISQLSSSGLLLMMKMMSQAVAHLLQIKMAFAPMMNTAFDNICVSQLYTLYDVTW